jgi:hypothetical protein
MSYPEREGEHVIPTRQSYQIRSPTATFVGSVSCAVLVGTTMAAIITTSPVQNRCKGGVIIILVGWFCLFVSFRILCFVFCEFVFDLVGTRGQPFAMVALFFET